MENLATWIALCAVVISILVAISGYLHNRPVVAASTANDLRIRNRELEERVEFLERRVKTLEDQLNSTLNEREWWMQEYRKLKAIQDD